MFLVLLRSLPSQSTKTVHQVCFLIDSVGNGVSIDALMPVIHNSDFLSVKLEDTASGLHQI
jgi:hypothetical protein